MPYTGTRFWFRAVAGEGTPGNVWRLMDVIATGLDQTSKANFGTGTTPSYRLVKPGVSNPTAGTPDATADGFGWNILKSDMNVAGAERTIPAGDWTVHFRLIADTADTTAAAGTYRAMARIYKRSAAGTFTELGWGEANIPSANIAALLGFEQNVTVTCPAVTLLTDETIHFEMWIRGKGITALGQIVSLEIQNGVTDGGNTWVNLPTPGLKAKTLTTLAAVAGSVASQVRQVRKPMTASGVGAASVARRLTLGRVITASSPGLMTDQWLISKRITTSTTGVPRLVKEFRHAVATTTTGLVTVRKSVIKVLLAISPGVAVMARRVTAFRVISAATIGESDFIRRLIFGRTITTTATGIASMARRAILGRIISAATTGTTTITKLVRKTVTAASSGLAALTRIVTAARVISVTTTGLSSLAKQIRKRVTTITVGTASMARRLILGRIISTATMATITVAKLIAKRITTSGVGVAVMDRALVATRIISAVTTGVSGFVRALIFGRTIAAAAQGKVRIRADLPIERIPISGGPTDWPLNAPTKTISGVVRDIAGAPYAGATVQLVRESDGFVAATATSAADGTYSFTRGGDDPHTYRVVAWEDTGTPTQGVSGRGLVGA